MAQEGRDGDRDSAKGQWAAPMATGSALPPQKVMHTRKRHSELYHELNQKFHTLDRYRAPSTGSSKVRRPHPALVYTVQTLYLLLHGLWHPGEIGGTQGRC